MQEIFKLVGKIALDGQDAVNKGLLSTEKKLQSVGTKMEKFGKATQSAGMSMSKYLTAPIMAGVGAIVTLGINMGNTADEILDLASATGHSTKQLQEWRALTQKAGTDTNAMAKASMDLTRAMSRSSGGSATLNEALEQLGLNFQQIKEMTPDERMHNLTYALANVEDATEKAMLGNVLFRGSWQKIAPVLDMNTSLMDETINRAKESGQIMSGEALNSANEFRMGMEDLKISLMGVANNLTQKLLPSLKNELIPFIETSVIPALEKFAGFLGELADKFNKLTPTQKKFVVVVTALAVAFGPLLIVLGTLATSISSIIALMPVISGLMVALTGPVGIVVLAIVGLITLFTTLYLKCDWFRDGVNKVWDKVKEYTAVAVDYIGGKFEEFKQFLKDNQASFDKLKSALDTTWGLIKTAFEIGVGFIKTQFEAFRKTLELGEKAFGLFKTGIDIAWSVLKFIFDTSVKFIQSIFETFRNILNTGEKDFSLFKTGIDIAWGILKGIFAIAMTIIQSHFVTFKQILETGKKAFDLFKQGISITWDALKTIFSIAVGFIVTSFNPMVTVFNTVKLAFNVFKSALVVVWDTIKTAFNTSISAIISAFSPMYSALSTAKGHFNTFKSGIISVFNGLKSGIQGQINSIKSAIGSWASNVMGTLSRVYNKAKSVWNWVKKVSRAKVSKPSSKKSSSKKSSSKKSSSKKSSSKKSSNKMKSNKKYKPNPMSGGQVYSKKKTYKPNPMSGGTVRMHSGGMFNVKGGDEALAMLKKGEVVLTGEQVKEGLIDYDKLASMINRTGYVINNTFTPAQSTPYEHTKQQEKMLRRLGDFI